MFGFKKKGGQDIQNPLNINKNSMIEFKLKELEEQGFFCFGKIIQMDIGQRPFTRYLVYSRSEETEYVFEVYKGEEEGQLETYVYFLDDTIPFSEEFLEVVGQKCITTPDGTEYERCTTPEYDYRIDGVQGSIKVYDLNSEKIEYESEVEVWDYQRDAEGITEYLNIEMLKTNGMFRIFIGQRLEGSLYKVYQGMEEK
ncbi:hypothetical protein [Ruminiclostridium josui]|uniref:hypothetical protein n=1 Tax=Ruminiclostridium josui TaxID=1499 RepID=UPI000464ECD2